MFYFLFSFLYNVNKNLLCFREFLRRKINFAGFYFIPGALSVDEQCRWIRDSLMSFPQPPNRTNHNAIYGPISDLFVAAKERKVLVEDENMPAGLDSGSNGCVGNVDACRWSFCKEDSVLSRRSCKSVSASVLLRKLRWSTLGLQFDWSKVIADSVFFAFAIPVY